MEGTQEVKGNIVTFKGKVVDLSKVFPLKLRNWKELEKMGVSAKQFESGAIQATSSIVFYVLNRADGSITQDDVDDLSINDPIIQTVIKGINGESADRPL